MAISRALWRGSERWVTGGPGDFSLLESPLASLLALPLADARAAIEAATERVDDAELTFLAPVDRQEVWAAGVTYRRSRDGRAEEATDASIYDRVYGAARPEVFFKSSADRVVGDGDAVGIRADSDWNVPEPELALVVTSGREVFGFTVANDMSSRSIEGENPLYLPQAKVYDRACALGSAIVPVWEAPAAPFAIALSITRESGEVFAGTTSTELLTRSFADLVDWLGLATEFPHGAVLLTGTGIVPEAGFTLAADDIVHIEIDGIGSLTNPVVVVGRRAPLGGRP